MFGGAAAFLKEGHFPRTGVFILHHGNYNGIARIQELIFGEIPVLERE
jgi:hypothetical protein